MTNGARMNRLTTTDVGSTRASAVAEELRRMIMAGELKAGTRLRQVELAERFSVSTTPVREAFVLLARAGLVRHDAQRGVVVFAPTVQDVRENYEIRIALEPLATELAAAHISADELERIDDVVSEMRASRAFPEYQRLNQRFSDAAHDQHEAIAHALQARDGELAKDLMRHHLADNAAHYMESSAELAADRGNGDGG